MAEWPLWAGDLPTWITTAAIGLAAVQLLLDRRKRAAEQVRESKAQASGLTAWTVSNPDATPRVYGVMVSNTSGSMFHDVAISAVMHEKPVDRPIALTVLPPGEYFVASPGTSNFTWDFPVAVKSDDKSLRPYMNTSKYQVTGMTFTDNLNQSWSTNEHALLTKV
ncbi:hypothetical protein GY21_09815 [Cryobacterium roopkundense]|uniref:Uncharacterized protein n=1 Tax=Cryobacterium roopkundense TaxID=1001240 RepID=A0A099JAG6_9MICO|nr:hypothetical protein [Cryobacterium roopkundense]KGJ75409.1 hypothetical protein GY21_09815 [Cryobacterium roopkundense]MBB5639933.1 hypothetical protein [Cryobacterium roopkundense]